MQPATRSRSRSGASDSLKVDALDFDSFSSGTALKIDGSGASVEFAGNLTDSAGISASVDSTGGQVISNATGNETISATSIDAGITEDAGVTISGSTIALSAQSSTTATITTDGVSGALDSATITTSNSATIVIDGELDATSTLSVLTNVHLSDTVTAVDGGNLVGNHAVSITGNNTSTVTLGTNAHLIGSSVDVGASTTVTSNLTAGDVGDNYFQAASRAIPPSWTGALVGFATDITNVTEVIAPATAQIDAGSVTVPSSNPSASLVISAVDTTNITSDYTTTQLSHVPVINGVLIFTAVDGSVDLDRTTEVEIGDTT